jgi:hypothetical protein
VDKKMFVLLVAIVMIVAAFAGCSEESSSPSPPVGKTVTGAIDPESGWIQQDGGGTPSAAAATFSISINATNLKTIEFKVRIEDSDSDNSETDEGSEPDDIEVYVTSQGVETAPMTGSTPFTASISPPEPNATEEEGSGYFGSEWEIHISAVCNAGKNPTGPGGIFPIPFVQYVDQGVAYTYEVKFTYEEFPE